MYLKICFQGEYVAKVRGIDRNDLAGVKLHKDTVINLEDNTRFDSDKNQWVPLDRVDA